MKEIGNSNVKVYIENMKYILQKLSLFLLLYGLTAFIIFSFITEKKVNIDSLAFIRLVILILFTPIFFKYLIHVLVSPWHGFVEKNKLKKVSFHSLKVSVIIPAWNEEVGIVSTVKSVLASDYKNIEVIVINDGSTDKTHNIFKKFLASYCKSKNVNRIPITYRKISNGGKARALNYGLSLATGEIIFTVDADSVVDTKAIGNLTRHFGDKNVMSVAGNVKIGNKSKPIEIVQQLEYLYGFYFKKADSLLNSIYIVGGAAAAYRASIFKKLGNFDEHIITEDIEFSMRIQNAGYKIKYDPNAIIYTEGSSNITGLLSQRLRWKHGRLLTFYKYRSLFFSLKKSHSKSLTLLILPIHLFAEFLLSLEIILLIVFYGYTFYTHDFLPLIFSIVFLTTIITLQISTDPKLRENKNLLILAPVAWCIFYFIDFVEYQALLRSFIKLSRKEKLQWQVWRRVGVTPDT